MNASDAGTPVDPKPDTNGGTGSGAQDGSGGRSPTVEDLKALEQVHRTNLEKERERRAIAEQRIAELEARVMGGGAPPADPALAEIRALQEKAAYSEEAQAILNLYGGMTVAQLENNMLTQCIVHKVPAEQLEMVQNIVRNSQYRTSVADAVRLARGTNYDSVAEQNRKLAEELENTKKELAAAKTRVPSMGTVPAALAVDLNASSVTESHYNAVLKRGGPEALALMAKVNSPRGEPGHVEIEWGI